MKTKTRKGQTALHIAASKGAAHNVLALMKAAIPDRDDYGR